MWRLPVILREISANLIAERWRAVVLIAITSSATFLVVATELSQVRIAIATYADLKNAGRYVFVATAESGSSTIDATRCVALGHSAAVVAAGGYTQGERVPIAKAPGEVFEGRMMVGQMPILLAPVNPPSPGDIYISEPAAKRVGLPDGGIVVLGDGLGSAQLAVVDMSARVPDPGPWVWIPTAPTDNLDQCWVEVIPAADQIGQQWVTTWLTQGREPVIVTRLLREDRLRADPIVVFHRRPTKYAWAAAGIVVGMIFWLITWFRRSEIALYRTVGSSRSQTALIYLLPALILIAGGVLIGALSGVYLHGLRSPVTATGILVAARQALLMFSSASLVILLGTLVVVVGNIAAYIRQRL